MTPEDHARQKIDLQLDSCGWITQDMYAMNIMAGLGVAVREYQLTTGEADYGLSIDGKVAGVIEAKKEGENLTGVETQTDKYANGLPDGVPHNPAIPIGTFDFIIDECHRIIYNQWRQILAYFGAFIIGLTATPTKQTLGFFNQKLVAEYDHKAAAEDQIRLIIKTFKDRLFTDISPGRTEVPSP